MLWNSRATKCCLNCLEHDDRGRCPRRQLTLGEPPHVALSPAEDPAEPQQKARVLREAWPWPPEAGLAAARARQLLATQVPWPPGRSRCSRGSLRDRRRRRWQVHTPRCPPAARPHLHLLCTPISLQALRSLIQSCKSQQERSQAALGTAPSATGTQGDAAAPG